MNDRRSLAPDSGSAFESRIRGLVAGDVKPSTRPDGRRLFYTPDEVHAAAAAIPRTVPRWEGEVGPRWQITIMPGGVQLGSKDFGRIAISEERRIQERLKQAIDLGLSDDEPVTIIERTGTTSKRGAVVAWSAKSRGRMVRTLCGIDYSLITGDNCTPGMVTLTMPHDWTTVAPTPQAFKKIVNKFRDRYRAAWGKPMVGVWKMEFQFRKACHAKGCHDARAPHLHILTDVPQGVAPRPLHIDEVRHLGRCRRDDCTESGHFRQDMQFPQWLSHAWALSVGHPDEQEFANNLGAGTNVSYEDTLRYADAKRIAVYFTKHGTFGNKEYQNELPETWKAAITDDGEGGANYWGRWVVPVVRAVQEADEALIMHIARYLRHVHRAHGYVRTHEVWRLNTRTGEYRKRKVRRRVKYMRGHRGFLSVNDGVATARDIARLVAYHRDPVDWFDLPDERPFEDRARDLHIARAQRRPRSSPHSAGTSSARSSE